MSLRIEVEAKLLEKKEPVPPANQGGNGQKRKWEGFLEDRTRNIEVIESTGLGHNSKDFCPHKSEKVRERPQNGGAQ